MRIRTRALLIRAPNPRHRISLQDLRELTVADVDRAAARDPTRALPMSQSNRLARLIEVNTGLTCAAHTHTRRAQPQKRKTARAHARARRLAHARARQQAVHARRRDIAYAHKCATVDAAVVGA